MNYQAVTEPDGIKQEYQLQDLLDVDGRRFGEYRDSGYNQWWVL